MKWRKVTHLKREDTHERGETADKVEEMDERLVMEKEV